MTDFGWVGDLLLLGAVAGAFCASLWFVYGLVWLLGKALDKGWIR